jgi:integrase/recombinase XerD
MLAHENKIHKTGRPKNSGNGAARPLTNDEVHRVMSNCYGAYGLRNRAIMAFSFHSGMRIGTILKLTNHQVIDENNKIRSNIVVLANEEKSNRSHRYYLSQQGQSIINDYVVSMLTKGDSHSPFFPSPKTGGFISSSAGSRLVRNLFIKSGITDTSSHSGRKTFAKSLIDNGVGIAELSLILNHSSPVQTMKYVGNLKPQIDRAIINLTY